MERSAMPMGWAEKLPLSFAVENMAAAAGSSSTALAPIPRNTAPKAFLTMTALSLCPSAES